MSDEQTKRPVAAVGVYILRSDNKVLLIRSPKWHNLFIPPGGHIEYGESIIEAATREAKEELGLDIIDCEVIGPVELMQDVDGGPQKSIIAIECVAKLKDDTQEIVVDGREVNGYEWFDLVLGQSNNEIHENTRLKLKKIVEMREDNEFKDKWLRAQADYKNLQKEIADRRGEWAAMSEAQILEDFLPVYDNFCKAFAHEIKNGEKDFENWKKGIEYIMQQFWTVMKNHGIEKIETVGKMFDPNIHEAVGEEKEEGKKEHEIIREVDGGYTMNGKVIKVAKVIVNS